MELNSEFSVQEVQREKRYWTQINFVRREEEKESGLKKTLSDKVKGRKGVGLRISCPSKKKAKRRSSQKKSKGFRLIRTGIYDRVGFSSWLQNNTMLLFHATSRKLVCTKHVRSTS